MSYDEKCEFLARYFLADFPQSTEEQLHELAQAIQDCIEGFLEAKGFNDG